MAEENTEVTLRDELSAQFDAVEEQAPVTQEKPAVPPVTETEEQKADRLRDEAGRFAKADKAKPEKQKPAEPAIAAAAPVRPKKPDSWKKDYEADWEKLDPRVAEYIHQREKEFQTGVSVYKGEAENAKQLNEAIAPFIPHLQQFGVHPAQFIRNLGVAHQTLALGSPQEKVMMGAKIIRDYGIDPQALFQVLSGPPQQYQQPPQVNMDALVEAKLTEREIKGEFNKFLSEVDDKYPHYEKVKETMAGLLQAGLAQDYPSAYDAAIRLPKHSDLFEAVQQQQREKDEAERKGANRAAATRARSNAVSPRSSIPRAPVSTEAGNKSLREELESSFDSLASGRV